MGAVRQLALPDHFMRRFFLASLSVDMHHNAEALQHLQVGGYGWSWAVAVGAGAGADGSGGAAARWQLPGVAQLTLWSTRGSAPCDPLQGLSTEFPQSDAVIQLAALAHYNLQVRVEHLQSCNLPGANKLRWLCCCMGRNMQHANSYACLAPACCFERGSHVPPRGIKEAWADGVLPPCFVTAHTRAPRRGGGGGAAAGGRIGCIALLAHACLPLDCLPARLHTRAGP